MMTIEEVVKKLCGRLREEIDDSNSYCDMAAVAEANHDREMAKGLYMIGWDEYTHARFIKKHLEYFGEKVLDEDEAEYKKLHKRIEETFYKK